VGDLYGLLFSFVFPLIVIIAVLAFVPVIVWVQARRKEREAFYRSEIIKKIAESPASGAALGYLRENEQLKNRRIREGIKLGGLITSFVAIGLTVFLRAIIPGEPIYLVGLMPLLAGVALLIYAHFLAPRD
jgi:hypothetical protein